ncbi:MAG: murein biosynthesis integral membrane protein MurJ [Aggregatilineales bacterium]
MSVAVSTPEAAPIPSVRQLARSTALVMGLLTVAKLISLLQKLIIVQRFGVGAEWDTFVAANQVPEQVFNLIAGGALTYAFIPVFGGFLTRGDTATAWRLASNVVNAVFAAALIIAVVIFVTAPWLVAHVVAPGFDAESAAQTVGLMRVLLISLLIFSVSGLTTGVLQSHQRFFLPALAPIVYDLGVLFGAAVLSRPFGVYGIAYGAVIGAAGHFLVQVPGLIAARARWRPTLNVRDPELRRVIRLMIPRAIGLGLLNINLLVAISLASGLGPGAPSAYSWGWALMQLPETLIGTAMGVVIFPTLSVFSAANDERAKRSALNGAWRFILVGTIPAAVLMVVAGRQALGLLEGGAFDAAGADLIYSTLIFFAPGLIFHSSIEVVARSFYADKDTVTPLYVALLSAAINLGLGLLLLNPMGVRGLALANTIAVGTEVTVLTLILWRRWHGLDSAALWTTALKVALASAALGIVSWVMLSVLADRNHFVQLFAALIAGGIAFAGVAFVLRLRELGELLRLLTRRVTPSTSVTPASIPDA